MNANAIYRSKKLVKKLIRVGIAFRVLSVCSAAAGGPKCFPANLPALSLDLNGSAVLRRVIRLLVECNLPITRLDDVLHDDHLRRELLAKSGDATLQMYFVRQFPSVPKQTIAALSRR